MSGSFNLGIHLIVLTAKEIMYKEFFEITSFKKIFIWKVTYFPFCCFGLDKFTLFSILFR